MNQKEIAKIIVPVAASVVTAIIMFLLLNAVAPRLGADFEQAVAPGSRPTFDKVTAARSTTTSASIEDRLQVLGAGTSTFSGVLSIGSTTPYREATVLGNIAAGSVGTTTLSLESTGSAVAGCIELKGTTALSAGGSRWVRIYVGGGREATNTASAGTGGGLSTFTAYAGGDPLLVIEPGRCK